MLLYLHGITFVIWYGIDRNEGCLRLWGGPDQKHELVDVKLI